LSAAAGGVVRWLPGDDPGAVREVVERGGVVAFPTESSFGLGVDPLDARAVERLFALKGRTPEKALPVVAATVEALAVLGVVAGSPELAWGVARWPAALSVVVPLAAPIAASGGRRDLAVRIPAEPRLRELLVALGRPLTATSANASGEPALLEPAEVAAWLRARGADAVVVGDRSAPGGAPSTLVAFAGGRPRVLRPGPVPIS